MTAMLTIVAEVAVVALAWSQEWFVIGLDGADVRVPGSVAGGALLPLAVAVLASVAALGLAGPFFRVVIGILDSLLGVCVIAVSVWALQDPVRAATPTLIESTGLSGDDTLAAMVESEAATAWPVVAVVVGVLLVLTGIAVAVTSRAWPSTGAKYSRTRLETVDGAAIDDWDALTGGDDPTDRLR